jgi:SNF2 family DNA or RNA helicase
MSLTSIIRETCPKCGKIAVEKSKVKIGKSTLIKLHCGHLVSKSSLSSSDEKYSSIISSDGKTVRPYQIEGIKFLEDANAKAILADEQGLGKMVQALGLMKLHPAKLLPAIIVCPTTIKVQWMHETIRWNGLNETFTTQVISTGKELAIPGFGLYIITYDILKKAEEVFSLVDGINSIFLDECQRIKNHLSDRAKAVQNIVKSHKIPHIIPMSGTPAKNNAGELFTVFNLVAPGRFPHYTGYIAQYCDVYDSSWGTKVGGVRDIERFQEATKDIMLRRTKSEVLPDLPSLDRKFYHVELDRKLNKAYSKALDDLDDALYADDVNEFERSNNTLAIMARMRHITGVSKVSECIDFVTEYLLSSDRKLVIYVHHQDVAMLLVDQLGEWCRSGGFEPPLSMHSGLSGDGRAKLVEEFKLDSKRLMVASTLAAGEGLNLQFCSDAIMLERQWNPANEEQAEGRFHRFGQENNVSVTYMLASGTIDEYFTELVESKRAIIAAALDGKEISWDQKSLLKDLAEALVSRGREKWVGVKNDW